MKIAIIGIRGIPVVYSGYETFAEILSTELVKKGHKVTVYCRFPYVKNAGEYRGIKRFVLPTITTKNFDTFIHSLLSTIHVCLSDNELIYYLSAGNSVFSILPRIFGKKTVVNVDGLDWKRKKWGFFAKAFLYFSEFLATIFPNAIVTDSLFIKQYYLEKYKKESTYIPYGGFITFSRKKNLLGKHRLERNKYFVWNGRLVPENHIEELIIAFKKLKTNHKCVILGDDLYKSEYREYLHRLAGKDKRIVFTGFVDHDVAATVVRNAFAYVETKRSGGTHPSLVEAMSAGCLIISNNLLANKQVLQDGGLYYDLKNKGENLLAILQDALKRRDLAIVKRRAKQIYLAKYHWKKILSQYEGLFSCTG